MKKTFKIILTLAFFFTMTNTAFAADTVPEVTFDANTEEFSYKNTDFNSVGNPNLFLEFNGAIPGDSLVQEIDLVVKNIEDETVTIYLHSEGENEDYQTLMTLVEFTVYYDGDEVSAGTLVEGITLGSFTEDSEATFTVEFSIPLTVGNEVASLNAEIDWIFVAEIIEDDYVDDSEEDIPSDDPVDEEEDASSDDPVIQGNEPDTGDTTTTTLWMLLMLVSFASLVIGFEFKKNK